MNLILIPCFQISNSFKMAADLRSHKDYLFLSSIASRFFALNILSPSFGTLALQGVATNALRGSASIHKIHRGDLKWILPLFNSWTQPLFTATVPYEVRCYITHTFYWLITILASFPKKRVVSIASSIDVCPIDSPSSNCFVLCRCTRPSEFEFQIFRARSHVRDVIVHRESRTKEACSVEKDN